MISRDGLCRGRRFGYAKSSKLVELPPIPARRALLLGDRVTERAWQRLPAAGQDVERSTDGRPPATHAP
jgi:hypothetical protein